jgi:hypothetical protein
VLAVHCGNRAAVKVCGLVMQAGVVEIAHGIAEHGAQTNPETAT